MLSCRIPLPLLSQLHTHFFLLLAEDGMKTELAIVRLMCVPQNKALSLCISRCKHTTFSVFVIPLASNGFIAKATQKTAYPEVSPEY